MDNSFINSEHIDAKAKYWLSKKQAEEFLSLMSYKPTPKLMRCFAVYLMHFERCYPIPIHSARKNSLSTRITS